MWTLYFRHEWPMYRLTISAKSRDQREAIKQCTFIVRSTNHTSERPYSHAPRCSQPSFIIFCTQEELPIQIGGCWNKVDRPAGPTLLSCGPNATMFVRNIKSVSRWQSSDPLVQWIVFWRGIMYCIALSQSRITQFYIIFFLLFCQKRKRHHSIESSINVPAKNLFSLWPKSTHPPWHT